MAYRPIDYGELIKSLRKKHGLTQSQLSERLSIGKTAVSNYETGYSIPSAQVLEKISASFDMTLVEFLSSGGSNTQLKISQPKYNQPVNNMIIPYIKPSNIRLNILNAEHYMDTYVSLPSFMFQEQNDKYICTKMTDNSMENDSIRKNDFLFVRKCSHVKDNSIVLAIDDSKDEYYVRRCIRENHIVTLIPSSYSPEYSIIRFDSRATDFMIVGYVEKSLTAISNL